MSTFLTCNRPLHISVSYIQTYLSWQAVFTWQHVNMEIQMKTVAILSRKGGTGKTTIATNLAIAAEKAGHTTALIDLDPQASAAKWGDSRNGDTPAVISTHSEAITQNTATRSRKRCYVRYFGHRPTYRSLCFGCSTCGRNGDHPV